MILVKEDMCVISALYTLAECSSYPAISGDTYTEKRLVPYIHISAEGEYVLPVLSPKHLGLFLGLVHIRARRKHSMGFIY